MPVLKTADGCRLHVEDTGEGTPVVLIPGLGGSATFWAQVTPQLASRYRVISFDHRGTGRSDRPDGEYSIARMAADLTSILDQLGVSRAHFVGHSTGGVIAQVMALDQPERVASLVLSATWDRPDNRFRMLFETRIAVLEKAGPENYAALTQLLGFTPEWIEANPQIVENAMARAASEIEPVAVAVARLRMLLAFDRSAELSRIVAPTLVIGAEDDMVIAFERSVSLSERIPGARLLVRKGGHFYPRAIPDVLAKDVMTFLEEVS